MKKIFLIGAIFFAGCNATRQAASYRPSVPSDIPVNGKLFATLYQQRAAEYRALCFQAFNIARLRLDQSLQMASTKPKAIITDIDETVLDNSAYEAHQTLQGKENEYESWMLFSGMSIGDTVPGVATFLKYAASKGVTIFYITNRGEKERSGTLLNLQKFNLPNTDDAHFFPLQNISSKEERRQIVAKTYDVILLIGDNLADFSGMFDHKPMGERLQNTNILATEFGNRFIVIPNPVYGDWESSLYKFNYGLTPSQKDSVIKNALKSY